MRITYCIQRRRARRGLGGTARSARRQSRPCGGSALSMLNLDALDHSHRKRLQYMIRCTGDLCPNFRQHCSAWKGSSGSTYQSCPPRMMLDAPISFANAAISSDALFSPYRPIEFGGTLGASYNRYLACIPTLEGLCNFGMPVVGNVPVPASSCNVSMPARPTKVRLLTGVKTYRTPIPHHIRRHNPEPHIHKRWDLIPPSHRQIRPAMNLHRRLVQGTETALTASIYSVST